MKKDKKGLITKKHDIIFCYLVAFLPLLQFAVFYVYVNINTFTMTFQSYSVVGGVAQWNWVGFENFKRAFEALTSSTFKPMWKNSIVAYIAGLLLSTPLSLLFSNYIYKKNFGFKFAKVILYVPSIVSAVTLSVFFVYIADDVIPAIFNLRYGLLAGKDTKFVTCMLFTIWSGFGTNVIIYVGTMSGIPDSVIEAAKLDGATGLKEFFSITLPLVYPTITLFITVGVSSIFTNQVNLFTFFGADNLEKFSTLGYYLYKNTSTNNYVNHPYLATLGLIFSVASLILIYTLRFFMEKFGPSTEK